MAIKEYFIRKKIFVQKSLQLKYLALVLFTILGLTSVFVLTLYFTHWSLLTSNQSNPQLYAAAEKAFQKIDNLLMIEIPIVVLIATLASIIVSHKIAGPVFRLQKIADEVARGDLTHNVRLRGDDELKNLSSAFNTVIGNINLLVTKDKRLLLELSQLSDTLYTNLKDKKISQEEALVLIRRLNDLIGDLKNLIMHYKVEKS